ncbi:MAG TPA: hypothetical protein VGK19_08145 [Capsulimonadaceae bacterium]|jgi:hypothetical protein
MPTISAPLVETQQVVTGTLYQIAIAEGANGTGITRLEIGPYRFAGIPPQYKYPEAPTNELCPPDFKPVRWVTNEKGESYLRFEGGRIMPEDGDAIFQLTSNFPPSSGNGPVITIYRDNKTEDFVVPVPDYTQKPAKLNSRHDSTGLGRVYKQTGCMPQLILSAMGIVAVVAAAINR